MIAYPTRSTVPSAIPRAHHVDGVELGAEQVTSCPVFPISVPLTGPAAVWEPCVTGDDGAAASLQVHCQQSHLANQPVLWSPLSPEAGGGDREPTS